jgi:hypothetical protein
MSHRPLRCASCARRIRDNHPHVGVEDYATGVEAAYHARPECQERAAEDLHRMLERGSLYILSHYHVCPDEDPDFDCSGGCFAGGVVVGRN